ncbi:MAG: VWA domain-containing protein [Phycisphaerales bacterium]|nr:VWA domain-containing protein [Phycisphaerales bacterium]
MMWLTPWTGFILAACTVPLLLLLYFLKLRRSTQVVSSTLLWLSSTEDLRANAPFQRLRRNVLLLLQLLALIMLVLAVMQPRIEGAGGRGGRTILLVDRSASMQARDVDGGTRLEAAVDAASAEIDRLHAGGLFGGDEEETMIIAFAETAEIVQPFTGSRQQLQDALAEIEPSHGRSHIEDALNLARVYSTNPNPDLVDRPIAEAASLVLFSDGRIQDLDGLVLRGESLVFQRVGTDRFDNVSVAHVAAERPYDRPAFVEVFAGLANWNTSEVTVDVQLSVDGIGRRVEEVELAAAVRDIASGRLEPGRRNLTFTPFQQDRDAVIEVAVLREDSLAEDDAAAMVVPPPRQLRVGLITPERRLVRRIMEGLSLQRLEVMTPEVYESRIDSAELGDLDVLIFDAVAPAAMPPVPSIFLGRTPPTDRLRAYGEAEGQVVLGGGGDHPVLRYVDVDPIYVDRARQVQGGGDSEVILEGSRGPLMLTFVHEGREHVFATFDPIADSNWPYQRGLGVFLFNAVEYLGHHGDSLTRSQLSPGAALVAHLPADATELTLTTPSGEEFDLSEQNPARVSWGPIELSGLHEIRYTRSGTGEQYSWYESVRLPQVESDAAAASEVVLGMQRIDSTDAGAVRYRPLWPWAIGMCLLILLIEWWIYNRKIGSW